MLGLGVATQSPTSWANNILFQKGYLYRIHPAEVAAGLVSANLQFGFEVGDVRRYKPALDGVTDDTTPLQRWLSVGGMLTAPVTATAIISATLNISANSRIYAFGGFTIKQKNAAAIAGPLINGATVTDCLIDGLQLDGNAANNAAALTYGINLQNGSGNIIQHCYIHDTTQAGIEFQQEQSSKILDNWLLNCGRNLGTDNHGIMVISITATPLKNILIRGNTVDTAYRKGITVYSNTPGTVTNVTVEQNHLINCGLGGVYVANAPATTTQKDIIVRGNNCVGNYVNIQFSNVQGGVVEGNLCDGGTGQSIYVSDVVGVSIGLNTVLNSGADAIFVTSSAITSTGISVNGNTVLNSNTTVAANGAGIHLNACTYSQVVGNTVRDNSGSSHTFYGILEDGAADNNIIARNKVSDATTAQILTIGANTYYESVIGCQVSVGAQVPAADLDVNGSFALRDQNLNLVNGANNNVALPAHATTLRVLGPTAAFNITGIAGGVSGRRITLINGTAQTMTISYSNAGSLAANRILIGGLADLAITQFGCVHLVYSSGSGNWFVEGNKA